MIFEYNSRQDDGSPSIKIQPEPKQQETEKSTTSPAMSGNLLEKTLSKVLVNILKTEEGKMFFENILQPMNKPIAGSDHGFKVNNNHLIDSIFKIKTSGIGEKGPSSCGHIVTVKYTLLGFANIKVDKKTETFALGSEKIIPGLDAVIVGMKTGQTREAIIPGKYISKDNNKPTSSLKVSVTLNEIIPQNFVGDDVKIFDDEVSYKMPLVCGNRVSYNARITKLSTGDIIFDTEKNGEKINMKIGDLNYPVIFSHALHNKIPTGTRTVIAKGKLFQSFATNYSKIFPDSALPKEEYFMAEFYDLTPAPTE